MLFRTSNSGVMRFAHTFGFAALLTLVASTASAQWCNEGRVLSSSTATSPSLRLALPDGSGGAVLGWTSSRKGWIQRISSEGQLLWGEQGIEFPAITITACSDGAGGYLIAFGTTQTVVQRLSSTGAKLWPEPGLVVSQSSSGYNLSYPQLACSFGNGGMLLLYSEATSTSSATKLQHVTSSGNLQWPNPITVSSSSSWFPDAGSVSVADVIEDGAGGAYLAGLTTDLPQRLVLRRMSSDGTSPWAPTWLTVRGERAGLPKLVPDAAGGVYVGWLGRIGPDGENTAAFVQRVTAAGALLWGPNGAPTSSYASWHIDRIADATSLELIPDKAGGVIIFTGERRPGQSAVFAQRLNTAGQRQWSSDGKTCMTAYASVSAAAEDGAGGYLLFAEQTLGTPAGVPKRVLAQRIGSEGLPLWEPAGVIVSAFHSHSSKANAVASSDGRTVVAWSDVRRAESAGVLQIKAASLRDDGTVDGGECASGVSDWAQFEH